MNKETEARCFHCYRHYVEGTAAWALYMMRMGHKVTNPKYDPRVYHLPEGGMIHINGVETIATNQWVDYWCIDIPDGWEIYEEPTFNVGDWATDGMVTGYIERWGMGMAWVKTQDAEHHINLCNLRKLDPHEVIVNIGCLSGTVAPGCSDTTIMIVPIGYNGFGDVAIIPVAMLDTPTRELVESLLKAQEEEK